MGGPVPSYLNLKAELTRHAMLRVEGTRMYGEWFLAHAPDPWQSPPVFPVSFRSSSAPKSQAPSHPSSMPGIAVSVVGSIL